MVSVSNIVEKIIKENPYLEIALAKDIISYSKLARYVRQEVESELGKKVNDSAIIVAVKRIKEKSNSVYGEKKHFSALELNTTSNLFEITIGKTNNLPIIMKRAYEFEELKEGYILNVIQGNQQTTFIASKIMESKVKNLLKGERLIAELQGLAQISVRFNQEMYDTPGYVTYILKELSWNNINLIEVVSTYTELIIVLEKKNITKAYKVIEELLF